MTNNNPTQWDGESWPTNGTLIQLTGDRLGINEFAGDFFEVTTPGHIRSVKTGEMYVFGLGMNDGLLILPTIDYEDQQPEVGQDVFVKLDFESMRWYKGTVTRNRDEIQVNVHTGWTHEGRPTEVGRQDGRLGSYWSPVRAATASADDEPESTYVSVEDAWEDGATLEFTVRASLIRDRFVVGCKEPLFSEVHPLIQKMERTANGYLNVTLRATIQNDRMRLMGERGGRPCEYTIDSDEASDNFRNVRVIERPVRRPEVQLTLTADEAEVLRTMLGASTGLTSPIWHKLQRAGVTSSTRYRYDHERNRVVSTNDAEDDPF